MYYPATFIPFDDGSGQFSVLFTDFPGCMTTGASLDQAMRMASEALGLHVGSMIQEGDELPPPSTLAQARAAYSCAADEHGLCCHPEAIHQFVHFEPHLKSCPVEAPVCIYISRELADQLDEAGDALGLTPAEMADAALRAFLADKGK